MRCKTLGCLVSLLVLISAQLCSSESQFTIDDYLQLPEAEQLKSKFHEKLREAVLKLEVDENTHSADIMDLIWLLNQTGRPNFYYKTLEKLSSISSDCPGELVLMVKSLLAQMRLNPNDELNKKAYRKFLLDYGRRKFEPCSMAVQRRHFMAMERKISTKNLDKFFIAALNITQGKGSREGLETQLVERLKQLDLTRDELNVPAMQKVAYRCCIGGDSFGSFMNRECLNLTAAYQNELDILNLDKLFSGNEIGLESFVKINEYQRFCLAWRNDKKRELILANISGREKFSAKPFGRAW